LKGKENSKPVEADLQHDRSLSTSSTSLTFSLLSHLHTSLTTLLTHFSLVMRGV